MNSLAEIWNSVLDVLRANMTPTAMSTWFNDCEPVDINDKCMVLKTTTDFKRSIIESRFGEDIRRTLSDLFSCDFDIKLLVGDEVDEYKTEKKNESSMPEMDGYNFDNFIVGNSNKFAHAAAMAVAKDPGKAYNPLMIYGNSGLHQRLYPGNAADAKHSRSISRPGFHSENKIASVNSSEISANPITEIVVLLPNSWYYVHASS